MRGSRVVDRREVGGVERLPTCIKVLKNSMTSSFARSNRGMLVRSYAKMFWNGVPDRIIRLLLRIILSGTSFQNNFGELRTIMLLLLSPNDEVLVLLNPLTLARQNVT